MKGKKLLSLLVALSMALSTGMTAMATGVSEEQNVDKISDVVENNAEENEEDSGTSKVESPEIEDEEPGTPAEDGEEDPVEEPEDPQEPEETEVDKSKLEETIYIIAELADNEDEYTEESWEKMIEAHTTAYYVYLDENATQEEVDAAEIGLAEAIEGLVKKVDKKSLEDTIRSVGAYVHEPERSKYTEESMEVLIKAHDEATIVYDNAEATQKEVDAVEEMLLEAIEALELKVDKTKLRETIFSTPPLANEQYKYTEESWKTMEWAHDAAVKVLVDDEATQEEVDAAEKELRDAIEALELILVDKKSLEDTLRSVGAYVHEPERSKYTEESMEALIKAHDEAMIVYDNAEATQEEVDAAEEMLSEAIEGLVEKADKSKLEETIYSTAELADNEDEYTEESWEKMIEAHTTAYYVYLDENATQEEVDAAEAKLAEAIEGLVKKVDKKSLEDTLRSVGAYVHEPERSKYTEESMEALIKAHDEAMIVYDNAEATQEEVDAAEEMLSEAIEALELKPVEEPEDPEEEPEDPEEEPEDPEEEPKEDDEDDTEKPEDSKEKEDPEEESEDTLPKTGHSNNRSLYIGGLLLMALGISLRRKNM